MWELFAPGVGAGVRYKFLVTRGDGMRIFKADPLAQGVGPSARHREHRRAERAPLARRGMDAPARAEAPVNNAPFADL